MHPLITAAELAARLDADDLVVADVRWYLDGRSGLAAYEAGHIPGAVFVDLERDLCGPGAGRHPLPSAAGFAAAMSRAGIGDGTTVVAYDDAGGSIAARLWWMLDAIGHAAAVLDGGIDVWEGPLETGPPRRGSRAVFTPVPWPAKRFVDADGVEDVLGRDAALLLDARAPERYRGDVEPVDARAGHIPGAVNAPWKENLDGTGRFRAGEDLRSRYEELGGSRAAAVVASCGSGVTACHDLLALRLAGFGDLRLYTGSWSDWCADRSRPVATGEQPG